MTPERRRYVGQRRPWPNPARRPAYDSDALRKPWPTRRMGQRQADAGGRQCPGFQPYLYRLRNLVERFFNKLKHFRAIHALRKTRRQLSSLVKLAAARIWMRFMSR